MNNIDEKETLISCAKEKKLLVAYKLSKTGELFVSESVQQLWCKWFPEDEEYFILLPYKWNKIYSWISRYVEVHDTEYIEHSIRIQRATQRRKLNRRYKKLDVHTVLVKSPLKDGRLAKYLLVRGDERRTGDFGSLMEYAKKFQMCEKNDAEK